MDKPKIFVIMPFSDEFFESYEMLKRKFDDDYEFSNAGDEDNQQNILADIIKPIYDADIVLADLTGLNPNVMYELGVAHTFCKKTIVITRDDLNQLPFDLKQYRAKDYTTHFVKFDELISYLDKNFRGAIDGSVIFSNPVKDFIDKNNINSLHSTMQSETVTTYIDGEKGFVDFIADIEEDMEAMANIISDLTAKQLEMCDGVQQCTNEIERVNSKGGGKGTAAFVRKQSKKVAEYLDGFRKQMKSCNESIFTAWERIERNITGLLENQFSSIPDNQLSLIKFLKQLSELKSGVAESYSAIIDMKNTSLKNIGIERSLNQAIKFLDSDLTDYINGAEGICASIDRIIAKSKFVVGDITLPV